MNPGKMLLPIRRVGLLTVLSSCVLTVTDLSTAAPRIEPHFVRGDANADGLVQISDAIRVFDNLFSGGDVLDCVRAGDVNGDESLNITDGIVLLRYLFQSGPPPAAPFPDCGAAPSSTALECSTFQVCEYASVVAAYDKLQTIAGVGDIDDKSENGWMDDFEGGPATEAELSRPHFAMANAAGEIYIADKDAHAIRKIDQNGTITTVAGTNEAGDGSDELGPATERALHSPNGLWVTANGNVYILDIDNDKVRKLTPDGQMMTLFEVEIVIGRGLWVADDESRAYVASATDLKTWTPDGGIEIFADGFASLGTLVVDPDGYPLVTDRGASRVYRLLSDGERVHIAGGAEGASGGPGDPATDVFMDGVRSVWLMDGGGLLLATHTGSQIWYVDTLGDAYLFLHGQEGRGGRGDGEHFQSPGTKISEPRAVTVDGAGNIVLTTNDRGFVRVIERRPSQ